MLSQKGVTLFELLVAMLLLAVISTMIYSILNVSINFSQKGEKRIMTMERSRSLLDLMHRQIHSAWFDQLQKKTAISYSQNTLKLVTRQPLIYRDLGLALVIYHFEPSTGTLYYAEKKDFYNNDYDEEYVPDPAEMTVLLSGTDLTIDYDDKEETVTINYLGQEYAFSPRCRLTGAEIKL
ncbi:MAG: prepilin-type N-terminal cleavage/methylation domain-containing protein [Proteobacteria bacterium]|nr:prepilin-type N-terminal cleavage/methylation domain-containing protein [Pseudomonadota bacterium]MBU1716616.1 prepilin-type N-terminal cleavage/methylation domain-containing protein [Pseudomonadota bacterium]